MKIQEIMDKARKHIVDNENNVQTFDETFAVKLRNALDDNGVTIKARPWGEIGDTTTINGNIYKIVSEEELRDLITNDEPFDAVCTSKITNMQGLFLNGQSYNWRIKSWDVSNVTDMNHMFCGSDFNQDLNNWDVSSVYKDLIKWYKE